MGITEIFTDQANLSGLSNSNKEMMVTKVIHMVHIDVNDDHDGPVMRNFLYFFRLCCVYSFQLINQNISIPLEHNVDKRRCRNREQFITFRPALYFIWDKTTNTTIFSGHITHFPTDDE